VGKTFSNFKLNIKKIPNNDAFPRANCTDEIGMKSWGFAINA